MTNNHIAEYICFRVTNWIVGGTHVLIAWIMQFSSISSHVSPIRLEANHVIDKSQVWISSIPAGYVQILFPERRLTGLFYLVLEMLIYMAHGIKYLNFHIKIQLGKVYNMSLIGNSHVYADLITYSNMRDCRDHSIWRPLLRSFVSDNG